MLHVDAKNCMPELVTRGSRERMVKPATEWSVPVFLLAISLAGSTER